MDFTLKTYRSLISALKDKSLPFIGFSELIRGGHDSFIILRHDVDRRPENALAMAVAEAGEGIRASYHFRAFSIMAGERIISDIAALGHEVAYHYEDLSAVSSGRQTGKGEVDTETVSMAIERFRNNLGELRRIYPADVISMHGSPLSAVDNRQLWKYHDYHTEGIVCEPYFDVDVSRILYLTDTGRRWDGGESSIRDRGISVGDGEVPYSYAGWIAKPLKGSLMDMNPEGIALRRSINVRTTEELIDATLRSELPSGLILNTHPQRWTDSLFPWATELILQNLKNQVKKRVNRSKILS